MGAPAGEPCPQLRDGGGFFGGGPAGGVSGAGQGGPPQGVSSAGQGGPPQACPARGRAAPRRRVQRGAGRPPAGVSSAGQGGPPQGVSSAGQGGPPGACPARRGPSRPQPAAGSLQRLFHRGPFPAPQPFRRGASGDAPQRLFHLRAISRAHVCLPRVCSTCCPRGLPSQSRTFLTSPPPQVRPTCCPLGLPPLRRPRQPMALGAQPGGSSQSNPIHSAFCILQSPISTRRLLACLPIQQPQAEGRRLVPHEAPSGVCPVPSSHPRRARFRILRQPPATLSGVSAHDG